LTDSNLPQGRPRDLDFDEIEEADTLIPEDEDDAREQIVRSLRQNHRVTQ
jgi:hypothetical protein